MNSDLPMTFTWQGKRAEELSRTELYQVIHHVAAENNRLTDEVVRLRQVLAQRGLREAI